MAKCDKSFFVDAPLVQRGIIASRGICSLFWLCIVFHLFWNLQGQHEPQWWNVSRIWHCKPMRCLSSQSIQGQKSIHCYLEIPAFFFHINSIFSLETDFNKSPWVKPYSLYFKKSDETLFWKKLPESQNWSVLPQIRPKILICFVVKFCVKVLIK